MTEWDWNPGQSGKQARSTTPHIQKQIPLSLGFYCLCFSTFLVIPSYFSSLHIGVSQVPAPFTLFPAITNNYPEHEDFQQLCAQVFLCLEYPSCIFFSDFHMSFMSQKGYLQEVFSDLLTGIKCLTTQALLASCVSTFTVALNTFNCNCLFTWFLVGQRAIEARGSFISVPQQLRVWHLDNEWGKLWISLCSFS